MNKNQERPGRGTRTTADSSQVSLKLLSEEGLTNGNFCCGKESVI